MSNPCSKNQRGDAYEKQRLLMLIFKESVSVHCKKKNCKKKRVVNIPRNNFLWQDVTAAPEPVHHRSVCQDIKVKRRFCGEYFQVCRADLADNARLEKEIGNPE